LAAKNEATIEYPNLDIGTWVLDIDFSVPVKLQDVQVPADGERDNENGQDDPEDQVVTV